MAIPENYPIWHPFTQMKTAAEPIRIKNGKDTILYTEDGKELIDVISSWWITIHGHANHEIASAIAEQAKQLEQVIFSGFVHPPAMKLATHLLPLFPGKMNKLFFSDDGSTAVEVALKMALQYFENNNRPRKKILAFENAYHGDTFGAMSVSARGSFNKAFESLLFGVDFIPVPTKDNWDEVKNKAHDLFSKDKYAAFIFEPLLQGSAGMIMYEAKYLNELLKMCKAHECICIADEIFTGFGRTGKLFACNYLSDEVPDIVCVSKGLTGGFLPMGITACTAEIYAAFHSDNKLHTLFHGHSYTANPLACAAANASLKLFTDALWSKINWIATSHLKFVDQFYGHKHCKDVRALGTVLAIELNTGEHSSYFDTRRDAIYNYFIKKGLLIRPLGNVIYLVPPYCITEKELAFVYAELEEFIVHQFTKLL